MFKPTVNKCLVRADVIERTDAGIYLPRDTLQEKIKTGTIIEVGPSFNQENSARYYKEKKESLVKNGDKILFSTHRAIELTNEGESYLLIWTDDILAIT